MDVFKFLYEGLKKIFAFYVSLSMPLLQTFLFCQGLKVLDNSVENFASGAWQALGNAWKGGTDLVQKYVSVQLNVWTKILEEENKSSC